MTTSYNPREYWEERHRVDGDNYVGACIEQAACDAQAEAFWSVLAPHLPKSQRVLDYGCGTGRFVDRVRSLGCSYYGADINRTAISQLQERYKPTMFTEIGEDLPHADSCFGCVFSLTVLQHIPESLIEKVCQEIRRVTRPTGRIILIEDNNPEQAIPAPHMNFRAPARYLEMFDAKEQHFEVVNAERSQSHYLLVMSLG